jgi:hypothetical protein
MTARKPLIIGVLAAVAAVAAYWMLALSPKREEAARLGDEVAQVEQQLTEAQARLAEYRRAKDSYRSSYAKVARLGKAVPEDDDVRSLVVQLESAAHSTGVDFRSIHIGGDAVGSPAAVDGEAGTGEAPPPGATVGEAGFMTMPFSFAFRGKYLKLSDFMSELERFVSVRNDRIDVTGRLLVLESLSFETGPQGFPNIDAKIGATTYVLPSTEGLTAGGTPEGPGGAAPDSTSAALTPTTATAPGAK